MAIRIPTKSETKWTAEQRIIIESRDPSTLR